MRNILLNLILLLSPFSLSATELIYTSFSPQKIGGFEIIGYVDREALSNFLSTENSNTEQSTKKLTSKAYEIYSKFLSSGASYFPSLQDFLLNPRIFKPNKSTPLYVYRSQNGKIIDLVPHSQNFAIFREIKEKGIRIAKNTFKNENSIASLAGIQDTTVTISSVKSDMKELKIFFLQYFAEHSFVKKVKYDAPPTLRKSEGIFTPVFFTDNDQVYSLHASPRGHFSRSKISDDHFWGGFHAFDPYINTSRIQLFKEGENVFSVSRFKAREDGKSFFNLCKLIPIKQQKCEIVFDDPKKDILELQVNGVAFYIGRNEGSWQFTLQRLEEENGTKISIPYHPNSSSNYIAGNMLKNQFEFENLDSIAYVHSYNYYFDHTSGRPFLGIQLKDIRVQIEGDDEVYYTDAAVVLELF